MMSIAKINNPNYLFEHSKLEYLQAENPEEKGYFIGRLAKYQKLDGKEVDEKTFKRFISYGEDFKGVEIDPSPCKDFSIWFNRLPEEERAIAKLGWDNTIKEVCKAIEQNTYYRKTENGQTRHELAKGVAMAVFNHHTDRPVNGEIDLQLHSHIVIFPKVLGQDNKFHSHTLLDLKYEKETKHETLKYFDAVMNHGLAKVVNQLGYTVSPSKNGSFTIDGITDEMRKEFSRRTEQIKEIAGENASYAEKKKVSLQQRQSKKLEDLGNLRKSWIERMEEKGLTKEKLAQMKGIQQDKSLPAREMLKQEKGIISNKKLKTLALHKATFSKLTPQEAMADLKNSKQLGSFGTSYQFNFTQPHSRTTYQKVLQHRVKSAIARVRPTPKQATRQDTAKAQTTQAITKDPTTNIKIKIDEVSTNFSLKFIAVNAKEVKTFQDSINKTKELQRLFSEHSSQLNELLAELARAYSIKQQLEI